MILKIKKKLRFKFNRLLVFLIFIFLTLRFTFNASAIDSLKQFSLTNKYQLTDHQFDGSTSNLLKLTKKELSDIDVKVILAKKSCDIDDTEVSTPTFVLPKLKNEELEFYIFLNVTNKTRETINFARYGTFGVSNLVKNGKKIMPHSRHDSTVPATLALEPIKQIEAGKAVNVLLAKGVVFWNNSQGISQRILILSSIANNRQIYLQVNPGKYLIQFFYENITHFELEILSNIPFVIDEPQLGQQRKPHLIIEYTKKTWIGNFTTDPVVFELVNK